MTNTLCLSCEWFEQLPANNKQHPDNGGVGNCLANPPMPAVLPNGKRAIAQFPLVLGKMKCGLHSPKGEVNG